MSIKRFFVLFCLLLAILASSCKKNSTAPEANNNNPALTLPGAYSSSSALVTVNLTTNSLQTATDLFLPGQGKIAVSGAHAVNLKYLLPIKLNYADALIASDKSQLFNRLAPVYPLYNLTLVNMSGFVKMAGFTAKSSAKDSVNYYGSYNSFAYNKSTRTLTADSVHYFTRDSSASVIFDGSLTSSTIVLPANIETTILSTPVPIVDIGALTLNKDSTFMVKINYQQTVDSISGHWYTLSLNKIRFIYDGEDNTAPDTLDAGYELNSTGLTLRLEENAKKYIKALNNDDLIPLLEMVLGIDRNSLKEINVKLIIVLVNKDKIGKNMNSFANHLDPRQFKPDNILHEMIAIGQQVAKIAKN